MFGNVLAVLCGLAGDAMAHAHRARRLRAARVDDPYPVRAVMRPIDAERRRCGAPTWARHRQNHPHQYHNGGIWPFVGGFWVMALASLGLRRRGPRSELVGVARANAQRRAGASPNGSTADAGSRWAWPGQSWNAAAFLCAQRMLLTGQAPL